jgi:hypothetical protein
MAPMLITIGNARPIDTHVGRPRRHLRGINAAQTRTTIEIPCIYELVIPPR